jgi:putative aldouronate transport system substrate-binding protein
MKFMKRLYSEKLMNQDFLIVKDGYVANINQGKAGMVINSAVDSVTTALYADLAKLNPDAVLDVSTGVSGPHGEFALGGSGFAGTFMFPKSSIKTEQDLKNVLQFFDKLSEQPMIDLTLYGVEGRTYTMENGVPKINTDLYNNEINPLNQLMVKLGLFEPKKGDTPLESKWKQILVDNEKKAVYDPAVPYISSTYVEMGAQLNQQIVDARNKFIIGELDEAGWQSAIDSWRKNGGDKIVKEYTAEYAKTH